jgi:hypothetical protein
MNINSIYSSTGVLSAESIYGENLRNVSRDASTKENSGKVSFWGEDVVSISQAAREKLAAQGDVETEEDAQTGEDARSQSDAGGGSVSGSGGGGSSSESDAKLESLKTKLGALQASLNRASGSEVVAVSALVSQVIAEIAALESGAA